MALDITREDVTQLLEQTNFAEGLSEQELKDIGSKTQRLVIADEGSRQEWLTKNEVWLKLAAQVVETKSYPWPGASNIKYPLLTTAAMQFHARAQAALVKGSQPVLAKVIGKDPTGEKKSRAGRISKFMSYQVLHEIIDWEEDHDRLLFLLPIIGLCFKKTYYSPSREGFISELVLPQDLIVSYYGKDFEKVRKTHRIEKDANEIEELMRAGIYRDIPLPDPTNPTYRDSVRKIRDRIHGTSPNADPEDFPYIILECHGHWDLDGDGYKEPWIVTIEETTGTVLRIAPRFEPDGVKFSADGKKIMRIDPIEYFQRYVFLPDLVSKIYGTGLGIVLGPMNEATNTVVNQLIDSGTLSVMPSGFLGRGVRLPRGGPMRFRPGEWKELQSTGPDLRQGVFPLQIKEPSAVLFNLLGLLINSGEKLGSINEAMLGENPGQNQPFKTTQAILDQGMKVFAGIYKRLYRALAKEYQNIYRLNKLYLDPEDYQNILDDPRADMVSDFETSRIDIVPAADPDVVHEIQALYKSESLLQKAKLGFPINIQVATRKSLEAEGHEDIEEIMNIPEPKPTFDQQIKIQELELKKQQLELDARNSQNEAMKDRAQAISLLAKAQATTKSAETAELSALITAFLQDNKQNLDRLKIMADSVNKSEDREVQKNKPNTTTNS